MKSTFNRTCGRLLTGAATVAFSAMALSSPAHAIVTRDDVDNNTDREDGGSVDAADEFSGVGMFFRADGFVCSGTLINPRTVIFAAHCVNDRDETDYNRNNIPAAWSFNPNALPGFQEWFGNGFMSNPDAAVFNVNRIWWNPASTQRPESFGFLEGDVAMASLDTPAANLPTWSLLFSPLPSPDITVEDGTGYHVNITGYGRSGNGTSGDFQGIDWRRRAAENMLGSLASLDDRNLFLFGTTFGDPFDPNAPLNPQVLYSLDFDDPTRTNPFDFNLFKDNARANEGSTAGGDSGGPLILDAANNEITDEDLVIAVLSGGSRFFGPQVFSSYGTQSFYQPLFLFWDYIVANNPYKYVTAVEGDGNWEDENHWVTTLDPNYRIIDETGTIVNGLPTTQGNGITGDQPKFGRVCFEQFDGDGNRTSSECEDFETGEQFIDDQPVPPPPDEEETVSSNIGRAEIAENSESAEGATPKTRLASADRSVMAVSNEAHGNGQGMLIENAPHGNGLMIENAPHANGPELADNEAHNGAELADNEAHNGAEFADDEAHDSDGGTPEFSDEANPDPTLANGLPGATGFVPNNVDPIVTGDPDTDVDPRYYDVTLGNAGTTTLSSDVTIDRLKVLSTAGLRITEDGSLTSLIDISQFGGTITVDGNMTSVGDFTMFGGALQGTGTVTAPFVTNMMGAISPSTIGGIGTLKIDGSLVLSSASTFMVDIDSNGNSDLLAVTGEASLGGIVAVGAGITGQVNGQGQQYTILTADGGRIGTFDTPDISPILRQRFTYTGTSVIMEIIARSYRVAIDGSDPVQRAYAQLFNQNRGNAALAGLYGLDFATAAEIQATFQGLAPVAESAARELVTQSYHQLQSFNASRLRESTLERSGGTVATIGNPIQTAGLQVSRGSQPIVTGTLGLDQSDDTTMVRDGAVREDVAIFLAGGLLQGSGVSMPGYTANGKTDVDGYFFGAGIEYFPSESSMIGLSVQYSDLDADVVLGQRADSSMLALSLYGSAKTEDGFVIDGQVSLTDVDLDTQRTVSFLGGTQTLSSDSSDGGFAAALGLSYDFEGAFGTISPGIEVRYVDHSLDVIEETGGILALRVNRADFESFQGRIGFDYQKVSGSFQIDAYADWVHEYNDGPFAIGAQFAAGTGPAVPFRVTTFDKDWGELGLSAQFGSGAFQFGLGVDTTIARKNANAQTYRAMATIKF